MNQFKSFCNSVSSSILFIAFCACAQEKYHQTDQLFQLNIDSFYKVDSLNNNDTCLIVTNISKKNITGSFHIYAMTENSTRHILDQKSSITIDSGASHLFPISLPVTIKNTFIYIEIDNDIMHLKQLDTLVIPYVLAK